MCTGLLLVVLLWERDGGEPQRATTDGVGWDEYREQHQYLSLSANRMYGRVIKNVADFGIEKWRK